jgi:imidazolonepropionase-like amidohydrolase
MQRRRGFITALTLPLLSMALPGHGLANSTDEIEGASAISTIRCGNTIDGISDQALGPKTLTIEGGLIISMAETSAEIAVDLDLSEYTCLPGLINTHVHFDANPEDAADYGVYARRTRDDNLALILRNAATTVHTGFTTVRHAGAWFPDTLALARAKIDAGTAIGPRIQSAGPYLTIPGGGGDLIFPEIPTDKIPAESQQGIATTPRQFAERAKTAINKGADFLKVIASGAVFSTGTEPGAPEMHQDDIEAVVAVAKAHGVKVTAHVHSDQSGRDAILAGVNSLEHASLLSDETIALAVAHDVALSMDVYNGTYTDTVGRELGYPEEFIQRNFDTTEAQRVVFEKAVATGATLLYGTDAGVLPHDMGGWQFDIMVERGMTPMQAIKSATSVAAEHMELDEDIGSLRVGLQADMIAVLGNPLSDMKRLRDVSVVLKAGVIIKAPPTAPSAANVSARFK